MAKADDTSSTIDGIWLRDALVLAAAPFGSAVLAKERLREWMASGQLPWSCMSFEGPDADDITRLREEERESIVGYILPWAAYHKSDPAFWCADLTIWWNKNAAREKSGFGARALGIKVSHEHLLGLLPGEPRERVEELGQTKPAEPELLEPKAWLDEERRKNPQQPNELPGAYASRLFALMQAAKVTKPWAFKTLLRRLYDK